MNFIRPPDTELLQFLTEWVTWRCDPDLWPLDLGVMSRGATWVPTTVPSLNWIALTVPELRRLQFSSYRQLSHKFYVFGGKWGQVSNFFITSKRHYNLPLTWPMACWYNCTVCTTVQAVIYAYRTAKSVHKQSHKKSYWLSLSTKAGHRQQWNLASYGENWFMGWLKKT